MTQESQDPACTYDLLATSERKRKAQRRELHRLNTHLAAARWISRHVVDGAAAATGQISPIQGDTSMAKQRTITLTNDTPVKIDEETWPVIAEGDYPGQYDFQACDLAWIKVRRHQDGRTIVYGGAGDGRGGGRPEREDRRSGYLLASPERTVETIQQVAEELAETAYCARLAEAAGRRCIADLPAEVLS